MFQGAFSTECTLLMYIHVTEQIAMYVHVPALQGQEVWMGIHILLRNVLVMQNGYIRDLVDY